MQSKEATEGASEKPYAERLYPFLILKLQKWNEVRGIAGIRPRVAILLELWLHRRLEMANRNLLLQEAAVEKSIVDAGLLQFERLRQEMKQARSLEEKNRIYRQAREILGEVGEAVGNLEAAAESGSQNADETDGDGDNDDREDEAGSKKAEAELETIV